MAKRPASNAGKARRWPGAKRLVTNNAQEFRRASPLWLHAILPVVYKLSVTMFALFEIATAARRTAEGWQSHGREVKLEILS